MAAHNIPVLNLAVAQGHAIFLDCRADRYFALSPAENDAVLSLLAGAPVSARTTRALTAAIGVEATQQAVQSLLAGKVTPRCRLAVSMEPPSWPVRLAAVRNLVTTSISLRVRGLHRTLERLPHRSSDAAPDASSKMTQAVRAHHWLSRHVTAHDACLVRSLSLARHLWSRKCNAQLVIAVKADPFAAHCWVQLGDQLLNEDLDIAAAFEPILVVR